MPKDLRKYADTLTKEETIELFTILMDYIEDVDLLETLMSELSQDNKEELLARLADEASEGDDD
jgi:hypothetical protein